MSSFFIEWRETLGKYVALRDGQIRVTGNTQEEAADRAHRMDPEAIVMAERVRRVKGGSPDKWRRIY